MTVLRFATFAMFPLAAVAACDKRDGGGSATSASSTALVSGACSFMRDKPRCQPGDKAVFCQQGTWQSISCPSCKMTDLGARCSAYTAGEPCDLSMMDVGCAPDGQSSYGCELSTKKIKTSPCAGCRDAGGGSIVCN
jgi:hypothetical protein